MEKLVILKRHGRYSLSLRTHDLSGTDYSHLLMLSQETAHAIAGPHTGISFQFPEELAGKRPERRLLRILRRKEREPNCRSWQLMAGDTSLGFIDDEAVRILQAQATVSFEVGEPNWQTRKVEDIDDQIVDLTYRIEVLQERRAKIIAESEQEADPAWKA